MIDMTPDCTRRLPGAGAALLLLLLLAASGGALAQSLSLELSTMRDQNIFDAYQPFPDQITQFQASASTDWDYDYSNMTLAYYGTVLLFRDLTPRNYHVHLMSLSTTFHFEREDEEEEDEEAVSDDQGEDEEEEAADGDSTEAATPPPQPPEISAPVVHNDSLDRYLSVSGSVSSQFDKSAFAQYDNAKFGASAIWREPLGEQWSFRPSYALTYHSYPNIGGISNVENKLGLLVCLPTASGGWFTAGAAFGVKAYTSSATYTYTIDPSPGQSESGHGKGGGTSGGNANGRTRTITLNSPAVKQVVLTAEGIQKVGEAVRLRGQVQRFTTPSSAARILPQQLDGSVGQEGMLGLFASQNEIFDDRYGYSGNEFLLDAQVTLPFALTLGGSADYLEKTYTIPAKDLADSVILADARHDFRFDVAISVSRPIPLGQDRSLTPKAEAHFLRNRSNAPYYDFHKQTFLVGLEYSF